MVHGYNGSCEYFVPYPLALLARQRRVLALDLPGCGLSDRPPECTLESYVDCLASFMDALGIEQADLLGHSMGGQIAIAAVARHPKRFRKLVLVDSAGLPELIRRPWLAPVKMLTDPSIRQIQLYPSLIKLGLRARAMRDGLTILRTKSIRRELKQVSRPTLIIWGSKDRIVPLEHGAFMKRHIPDARLVVMRGSGHMPFTEQPQQFAGLVQSFLRT
jgi:pimeloyl-ACP methyl ester carboxylesterase